MTTPQQLEHHSIFEYLYRDAGNFKIFGVLLLTGYDSDVEAVIRDSLEWGDQFVAEQVGVPALCREHWESVGEGPSDLDHAYHEFLALRPASADELGLRHWGFLAGACGPDARSQGALGRAAFSELRSLMAAPVPPRTPATHRRAPMSRSLPGDRPLQPGRAAHGAGQ